MSAITAILASSPRLRVSMPLSTMPLPASCHPERTVNLAAFSGPHSRPLFGVNGQSSQIGPEGSAPLLPRDRKIHFLVRLGDRFLIFRSSGPPDQARDAFAPLSS